MSPTELTLKKLRDCGWTARVVEKTIRIPGNPRPFKRDLFGCDVLGIKPGCGNILVQCCAATDHARRRDKLIANPEVLLWLSASEDNRLELWSWAKRRVKGTRLWRWQERVEIFNGVQIVNEMREAQAKGDAA